MSENQKFKRVLKVARLAQEMEAAERDPIEDTKSQYIKEINHHSNRRNYNVEAYEQVLREEAEKEKDHE